TATRLPASTRPRTPAPTRRATLASTASASLGRPDVARRISVVRRDLDDEPVAPAVLFVHERRDAPREIGIGGRLDEARVRRGARPLGFTGAARPDAERHA